MGNINSINSINSIKNIKKLNFEDMKYAIDNKYIIINTLHENNQNCLIENTISPKDEVIILNKYLKNQNGLHIVVYGKNNNDEKIFTKYIQLINLGFTNVSIYIGGLFEWLLLQEVYGDENFMTTSKELDILKYK